MDPVVESMRAKRSAKLLLNDLIANRQISSCGLKWLEIATDPFHDTEIQCEGYPDMVTTRSIVQTVTKTFTVVAPSANTWDCHVFFAPLSPVYRQGTLMTTTTQTAEIAKGNSSKKEEEDDPDPVSLPVPKRYQGRKYGELPIKYRTSLPFQQQLAWMLEDETFCKEHPDKVQKVRDAMSDTTPEQSDEDEDYYDSKDYYIKRLLKEKMDLEENTREGIIKKRIQEIREKKTKSLTVTLDKYYRSTVSASGFVGQAGTGNTLCSGWNVMSCITGDNWQTQSATEYEDGAFPRSYGAGTYRLIATGLEVVNTTASLYKGGSVTCYRSPCPKSNLTGKTINLSGGTITNSLGSFPVGVLPPSTEADAALYPNSRTWGAEKGIYLVGAMNSTDNPYFTPSPGISGLLSPTSSTQMETGTGWVAYLPRILAADADASNADLSACSTVWPWDISGAIFSGLNQNSTLQVTVRYYIERHPSIAEPDLLVLAKTPCPYDPMIQEIYARAMHQLPVGVPVGMNPLGEWFNEVLDAVATWAPELGSAVGNIIPGAAMVGKAIGTGASGWLKSRKNIKGGGLPAPKPPKGGVAKQKVKLDRTGHVKEIDTLVKGKKKKYTKAQKRAYKAAKLAKEVGQMKAKLGPKRGRPTNVRKLLKARGLVKL